MMNFGVSLMMYFCVGALDEGLLLIHRNDNSLTCVPIRGDGQKSMWVALHHLQVSILVQMLVGDLLTYKLLSYPRRERGLSLLSYDNFFLCCMGLLLALACGGPSNRGESSTLCSRLHEHGSAVQFLGIRLLL